jgi:hypothetical protein
MERASLTKSCTKNSILMNLVCGKWAASDPDGHGFIDTTALRNRRQRIPRQNGV